MRLENAEYRDGLWLMDFILMRTKHGPAKVGMNEPATGFPLELDEGFGEETAFLWDPSNDWCVAQYNHHGVRPGAISNYLGNYVHDNPAFLELQPKIDPEVHSKVKSKKLVTKFTVSIAPQQVNDYDYDLGAPMNEAVNSMLPVEADHLEITVTASKKKGLVVDIQKFIEKIRNRQSGPITGAHAVVRSTMDDEPEALDLLLNKIIRVEEITAGPDKRFPQQDRWNALLRAHNGWRKLMT